MIETNLSACVLTYYEAYGDLQGPNFMKNMQYTLSDKISSDKIFVGQNISSDKIFDTEPKFRQFCPTNFCLIRYILRDLTGMSSLAKESIQTKLQVSQALS